MRYAITVALGGLVCLTWVQCMSSEEDPTDRYKLLLQSLAENVALVHYEEFVIQTEALANKAKAFCESPTDETLQAVRAAWWSARTPWKKAELVKFGPFVEYPWRYGPKIDLWPANESAIEDLITSELALDAASFDTMGGAIRGLPMLGYLLWKDGDETLKALSSVERRCDALAGASQDVHLNAKRLVETWKTDWVPQLSEPEAFENARYESTQAVVDEWVNRMAFTVENIRKKKIGKPIGDKSDGKVQPDALESRYSGRSLQDALDALAGVHDVWTGDVNNDHLGIVDLAGKPALVEKIDELFKSSEAELSAIPEPLEDSLTAHSEQVRKAQKALQLLQLAIQADLAESVGVTITFNDADGD